MVLEMRAMRRRRDAYLAQMTESSWVAAHADHKDMARYRDTLLGVDRRVPPEALGGLISAAAAGLPKMTWAEFRKSRES